MWIFWQFCNGRTLITVVQRSSQEEATTYCRKLKIPSPQRITPPWECETRTSAAPKPPQSKLDAEGEGSSVQQDKGATGPTAVATTAATSTVAVLLLQPYVEQMKKVFLKCLKQCTIQTTANERVDIDRAFDEGSGRWWNCGGATEVEQCNECGASVGVQNHVLVENNYFATEMDGSQQPFLSICTYIKCELKFK